MLHLPANLTRQSLKLSLYLFLFLLISCDKNPGGYKYQQGHLPSSPVNLEAFNTMYDDYNSTAPSLGRLIPFCFSTNRNSSGADFDVIYQPMNVNFDKTSGVLTVINEYANWITYADTYQVLVQCVKKVNTTGNELGPELVTEFDFNKFYFTLMYASDFSGNFQINFTSNKSNPEFSTIRPVTFLNSPFDDLYPTFSTTKTRIYFCSNREDAQFDIYYAEIPNAAANPELILADTSQHTVGKDTVLSSNYNDKCPFIYNNFMVFTSDRPGGFGGFDLYYARFENNSWSSPVNLGSTINSEFDEYRPILMEEGVSATETMMVFSSNRTGGKGGFDLYFVGVKLESQ
jgi:hypothetical protein